VPEKTNTLVQKRKSRELSEILTVKGRGTERVRNIKYLGTVISNTIGETEEVKTRILAANKAYSSASCI
jgi:hypothetical protein